MTTSSRIARLHAHCKAACACSRFTELNTLYDPHVHVALPSYQATWPAALCVVYSRAPRRGRARAGAGLPTAALARRRSGNRCEVCAHVGKGTKPTELWTLSVTPRVAGSLAVVHSAAVRPIAPSTAPHCARRWSDCRASARRQSAMHPRSPPPLVRLRAVRLGRRCRVDIWARWLHVRGARAAASWR